MTSLLFLSLISTASADDASGLPDVTPTALVQTWVTLADQDLTPVADPAGYGDPEDDSGFKIRRVRLGLEGANSDVKYGVKVGLSAPFDVVEEAQGHGHDVGLVDTYGGYSPTKGVWLVAGMQKVPVSREALISSRDLVFTDRAVSTHWLTPGRDLGMVADGSWKMFRLRLGAFNGGGDLFGDDNRGKLMSARLDLTHGDADLNTTYGSVDGFTIGLGVDGLYNVGPALTENMLGTDLLIRMAGLAVLVEGRLAQVAPREDLVQMPGTFTETQRSGALVQFGYTVGSFEPAIRYAIFDDDQGAVDSGDVAQAQAGMTWHSDEDRIRAGGSYVLRTENGGPTLPNDTVRFWMQIAL